MDYIKLEECKSRMVYRIKSRNLQLGVYDGQNGFIGIREKFNSFFLFTEYHYDQGAPYGTVYPLSEVEEIPQKLILRDHLDTECHYCRQKVKAINIDNEHRGWHHLISPFNCPDENILPVSVSNSALFRYLRDLEEELDLKKEEQPKSFKDVLDKKQTND